MISSGFISTIGWRTLAGVVLLLAAMIPVRGQLIWTGGVVPDTHKTILSGVTLSITTSANHDHDAITIANSGTMNWDAGAGPIRSGNGGGINNAAGGVFNDRASSAINSAFGGTTATFTNSGTYNKLESGTTTISQVFSNQGAVSVSGGTLLLSGGGSGSSAATYSVSSGNALSFGGGTHTLAGGAAFSGSGDVSITSGTVNVSSGTATFANLTLAGGTLGGAGGASVGALTSSSGALTIASLTLTGTSSWTGGSWNTSAATTTTVDSNATFTISGTADHDHSFRTITNDGTVNWTGGNLRSGNGGGWVNNSTFNDSASREINGAWGGTTATFTNASGATYNKTAGSSTIAVPFTNNSAVNVTGGSLTFSSGGSASATATFAASSGTNVAFTGGTYTLTGGAALSGTGAYSLSGGALSVASGTATLSNLTVNGGTLAGAGTAQLSAFTSSGGVVSIAGLTLAGTSSWTGGSWNSSSASAVTVNSGVTLTISGTADHDFSFRTITNNGTVNWTGGNLRSGNAGGWVNNATFNDSASSEINNAWGGTLSTFTNASGATYTKSSGTSTIAVPFTNNNAVNVTGGSLTFSSGGSASATATFAASSGTNVAFNGGTYTLTGGAALGGAGTYSLSGGTLAVASGTATLSNLTLNGGTLAGAGTAQLSEFTSSSGAVSIAGLTLAGTSSWTGGSWNSATASATTVNSGVTLAISGTADHDFSFRTITNNGTVNWTGGNLRSGNAGGWVNNATFNDSASSEINNAWGGTLSTFTNASGATYTKSSGTSTIAVPFTNNSAVNVTGGSLTFSSGGSASGTATFAASSGTNVAFNGGAYTLTGGAALSGTGTYSLTGGTLAVASGTATLSNLTLNGGTLAGAGTAQLSEFTSSSGAVSIAGLTLAGASTWTGGSWNSATASATTINSGVTLTISGTAEHDLSFRTITNNGTVNWAGGNLRSGNGGGWVNNATFNDTASSEINNAWGGTLSTFTNASGATYTKSSGTSTIAVPFTNNNAVNVTGGSLTFSSGGSASATATFAASSGTNVAFNGGTYTLTGGAALGGAGTYSLSGGTLSVASGTATFSNLTVNGGTLAGAGAASLSALTSSSGAISIASLTLTGTGAWSGGSWNSGAASTATLSSGSTLTISGTVDHDFNHRTITNNGTVNWTAGRLRSGNGGGWVNNSTFNDSASTTINNDWGGTVSTFVNAAGANYNKTATGTTTFQVPFHNSGAVSVTNGTLSLDGTGSSSGTFTTGAAGTVSFDNHFSIADGSSLLGTGVYRVTSGTFTVSGTVNVAGFDFNGGLLAGTHTFNGGLSWRGGSFSSAGTTTIGSTATLTIAPNTAGNAFDHDFSIRTIVNDGTVNWLAGSGRLRSGQGGKFINNGAFNDAASNVINSDYGGPSLVFTNSASGTYTKSAAGTTRFDTPFNNDGAVNISAGTFQLHAGGTNSGSGTFNAASGTAVVFSNSYTIADGSKLLGGGDYRATGGTLTVTGNVNVTKFQLSGSTLAGTHAFSGNVLWNGGTMNSGGTTTITSGAVFDLTPNTAGNAFDHDFSGRAIVNNGTTNWQTGAGNLRSGQGGTFTNNHSFNDAASGFVNNGYGGTALIFTNAATGTYNKTAGSTRYDVVFDNHGAVNLTGNSTLELSGRGTNSASGSFTAGAGSTVIFSDNYTIADGSKLLGAGLYKATAGTFAVNGAVNVSNFQFAGGTLAGTHTFTGALGWNGGSWNSSGTTTIGPTATLAIMPNTAGNAFDHDFSGRHIVNNGTINWQAGAGRLRSGQAATLVNNGAFNDAASSTINTDYGGTTLVFTNNAGGTYTKTAAGTTVLNAIFNNSGNVFVNAGTLKLDGGGTNAASGIITAAAGTAVVFSNSYTLADASSLAGAGAFSLTGGTLTATGTVNVSNFSITGGTLAGTQTFNGGLSWKGGSLNSAGTTTIASSSTFSIDPNTAGNAFDHDFSGRTIANHGTMTWMTGAGRLRSGTGGGIVNHGLFIDAAASDLNSDYGGTAATFTNTATGTYRKTTNDVSDLFVALHNSGTLDIQAGTLVLHSGGTFSNGASMIGAGLLQLAGGTLTGTGTMTFANFEMTGGSIAGTHTLAGNVTWRGGSFNNAGSTTLSGTFNIASTNDHDWNSHTFVNNGTVNWLAGRLRSGNGGTFTNNGTFKDTASSTWNNDFSGAVARFINAPSGIYNKDGAATTIFAIPFTNDGTINANAGALHLANGGASATGARFNAVSGASIRFTGGTYTVADGAAFAGAGKFEIAGATTALSGTITAADFQLTSGTLAGTQTFAGGLRWTGSGDMNAAGTTTIAPTGTLTIAGTTNHDFDGHAIVNHGTVEWTGGNLRAGHAATFTNHGTFKDTADAHVNNAYSGTALTFTNAAGGTYSKEGAGTTDFFVAFANHGTIHVSGGPLALHSGGTIGNGAAFTGTGQVRLASGTFTASGALSSTSLTIAGGTLAGTHTLNGTVTFLSGNLNALGTTTIASGGTIVYGSASHFDFDSRAIVNNGTFEWRAGAAHLRAGHGASFTNNALFLDSAASDINNAYSGAMLTFVNSASGTYRKTANTVTDVFVPFTNSGTIETNAGTLSLHTGGTINNGASFTGAGITQLTAGTFTGSGTFTSANLVLGGGVLAGTPTLQGTLTWNSGDLASSSSLTVSSTGKLVVATTAEHDLPGHALVNHGTIEWNSGNIRGGNAATIVNHGLFVDNAAHDINNAYSGTALTFTNTATGVFKKTAATTTDFFVPFVNSGTFQVDAGTLAFHNGGTINAGASFLGSGVSRLASGTFTANGAFTTDNLVLAGGTLTGSPAVAGTLTWNSGVLASGATTTITNTGKLVIATTADHDLPGHALVNRGTVEWTDGNLRGGNSATITNHGVFKDTGTHQVNNAYSGTMLSFTNATGGVYHKAGGNTTTFLVPFTNQGLLSVTAGTVVFSNTFTNTGGIHLANGAGAQFSGTLALGSAQLAGTGTITASSVTAGGVVAPGNSAGTLTLTGNLTLLATSTLLIELGGATQGTGYDFLSIGGNAVLAGNLSVSFLNGFQSSVSPTATFTILTAGTSPTALTGAFANIANGQQLLTSDGAALFTVNYGTGSAFAANSVVLSNFVAVPEPSTYVMLGAGAVLVFATLRRRRR